MMKYDGLINIYVKAPLHHSDNVKGTLLGASAVCAHFKAALHCQSGIKDF